MLLPFDVEHPAPADEIDEGARATKGTVPWVT